MCGNEYTVIKNFHRLPIEEVNDQVWKKIDQRYKKTYNIMRSFKQYSFVIKN